MRSASAAGDDRLRLSAELDAAAGTLGLPLSSEQAVRLIDFLELLFRWNGTYNLTAIRDRQQMLTHHVVDCLAAVLPLRRHVAGRAPVRILDVGSGGGLPGLVFAVMQPDASVTCVDSIGKKTAFLTQAAATLMLDNLDVVHARVEAMAVSDRYEVIVSRAFASLGEFTRVSASHLAEAGVWMAMKGKIPEDEIQVLPAGIAVFHVEPLSVPGSDASRCLVWMHLDHNESVRSHSDTIRK